MRDGRGWPWKEDWSKVRVLGLEEMEEEVRVAATDIVDLVSRVSLSLSGFGRVRR